MLDWDFEGDLLFDGGGSGEVQNGRKTLAVSIFGYETNIAVGGIKSCRIPQRRISRAVAFRAALGQDF